MDSIKLNRNQRKLKKLKQKGKETKDKYGNIRKSVQSFIEQVWDYYELNYGMRIHLQLFETDKILKECCVIIDKYSFNSREIFGTKWRNIPVRGYKIYKVLDEQRNWKQILVSVDEIQQRNDNNKFLIIIITVIIIIVKTMIMNVII